MKIAVLQTAFLGDCVLTLPLLQAIKKQYLGSTTDVITLPAHHELFALSPSADAIIAFDKKGEHKSLAGFLHFVHKLKAKKYDLWISPHRSLRSSVLTKMAAPAESIGFENASFSFVYDIRRKYRPELHEVLRNIALITPEIQSDETIPLPEISLPGEMRQHAEDFLKTLSGKNGFVLIAPGSVWLTKQYPIHYYASIAGALMRSGKEVLWFGAEKDREIAESIVRQAGGHNVCGKFSLALSMALLQKADLLICNDSAPAHLAAAVKTKTLMLYCATIPEFGFYPIAPGSRWLSEQTTCKPCNIHGAPYCPQEHFSCGTSLLPQTVITTALEMLNEN